MVDSIAVSLLLFALTTPPRSPSTGEFVLPAGIIELTTPISIPEDAHDLIISGAPGGTTLRAAAGFQGRALLDMRKGRNIQIRKLRFDGNRAALEKPAGLPPSDVAFIRFYANNGIAAEHVETLAVEDSAFENIAGLAVVIASSKDIRIERVSVKNSGSRNAKGRNNTTGGILIEEGTSNFRVLHSTFGNIRGNGAWTHSNYTSPRNGPGLIAHNTFDTIGRDAIQVGHATEVRVEDNRGVRVGYPVADVDVEGGGTPVGIDTAGNVDRSAYRRNRFEETNGKCIDLDGFHHGEVRANTCINRRPAAEYAFGHFAIVFNNTNPDMQSEAITVADNIIDGTKFGGLFLIGSDHIITGNRMRNLNTAGCTENAAKFGCYYFQDEPDLLRTGIYIGKRAERAAPARNNRIEDNLISGHKMKTRCIAAAPGILLKDNQIRGNQCEDAAPPQRKKK